MFALKNHKLIILFCYTNVLILIQCKQFKRCQLARELYWRHKIHEKDLPIWLCITYKSSQYNTDIIDTNKGNYGMFQINKRFCYEFSDEQLENELRLCPIPCDAFVDDDIKDDVKCVKKIYKEAKYFTGNGFSAWELYKDCKGPKSNLYIKGCNYRKPPKKMMALLKQKRRKFLNKSSNYVNINKSVKQQINNISYQTTDKLIISTNDTLSNIFLANNKKTFIVSKNNLSYICFKSDNNDNNILSTGLFGNNNTKTTYIENNTVIPPTCNVLTSSDIEPQMNSNFNDTTTNNNTYKNYTINKNYDNIQNNLTLKEKFFKSNNFYNNNELTNNIYKNNSLTELTSEKYKYINLTQSTNDEEFHSKNDMSKKLLNIFNWIYNQVMSL